MKEISCVPAGAVLVTSQHMSRLTSRITQVAQHARAVSLNPNGAVVQLDANTKAAEGTRNSTARKDLGPVVPVTAARAHNSDTFVVFVRLK